MIMLKRTLLLVLVAVTSACGSEEEDHGSHEFASHEECETHYAGEGYTTDEIEELCADVEDDEHAEGG
jgi:ABC-type glycerol-3-phosphate transport system substrate-binding protein